MSIASDPAGLVGSWFAGITRSCGRQRSVHHLRCDRLTDRVLETQGREDPFSTYGGGGWDMSHE